MSEGYHSNIIFYIVQNGQLATFHVSYIHTIYMYVLNRCGFLFIYQGILQRPTSSADNLFPNSCHSITLSWCFFPIVLFYQILPDIKTDKMDFISRKLQDMPEYIDPPPLRGNILKKNRVYYLYIWNYLPWKFFISEIFGLVCVMWCSK